MVPDDFGRGIVIPLLWNPDGNKFLSDNYRGITLSSVIICCKNRIWLVSTQPDPTRPNPTHRSTQPTDNLGFVYVWVSVGGINYAHKV